MWTKDGSRTLDDQSVLQLRLTRTDGRGDTPTADSVGELIQRLASQLPLQPVKEDSEETQG